MEQHREARPVPSLYWPVCVQLVRLFWMGCLSMPAFRALSISTAEHVTAVHLYVRVYSSSSISCSLAFWHRGAGSPSSFANQTASGLSAASVCHYAKAVMPGAGKGSQNLGQGCRNAALFGFAASFVRGDSLQYSELPQARCYQVYHGGPDARLLSTTAVAVRMNASIWQSYTRKTRMDLNGFAILERRKQLPPRRVLVFYSEQQIFTAVLLGADGGVIAYELFNE